MPGPKIREGGALVDAEEHLPRVHRVRQGVQAGVFRLAADEPAIGTVDGAGYIVIGRGILDALVKGHADIRAEVRLDLHALLRAHEDLVAVDVRGEIHTLLLDPAQACQREYLKSAGICQDRPVPRHKAVQAAQIVHEAVTGSQMQMVGVGKLDLTADGLEVRRAQRALDGALRADVHEHGRLHRAVRAGKYAPPRLPFGF